MVPWLAAGRYPLTAAGDCLRQAGVEFGDAVLAGAYALLAQMEIAGHGLNAFGPHCRATFFPDFARLMRGAGADGTCHSQNMARSPCTRWRRSLPLVLRSSGRVAHPQAWDEDLGKLKVARAYLLMLYADSPRATCLIRRFGPDEMMIVLMAGLVTMVSSGYWSPDQPFGMCGQYVHRPRPASSDAV